MNTLTELFEARARSPQKATPRRSPRHQIQEVVHVIRATECEIKYYARAKYYITPDGVTKLAKIQQLNFPFFRLPGFEEVKRKGNPELDALLEEMEAEAAAAGSAIPELYDEGSSIETKEAKLPAWKNLHRAKMNAFDKILCNPDLDTFATFTISPEYVQDRTSWDDVYHRLRDWLSNRVKRRGLKYVICPERHKLGGIHFHAIMNSSALKLTPATNAHTGTPLVHNGAPLYNVSDFNFGFTSAELIQSATLDREKVAKYIFKYMGKQGTEGKIGGRYALIGGELASPIYVYGNDPREFLPISEEQALAEAYFRESVHQINVTTTDVDVEMTFNTIKYREWSFI